MGELLATADHSTPGGSECILKLVLNTSVGLWQRNVESLRRTGQTVHESPL